MDATDSPTTDTTDIESVHKKVKLNGDSIDNHGKTPTTQNNESEEDDEQEGEEEEGEEEQFDFSSSDLEDLDNEKSVADGTDNEPTPIMTVKLCDDNDDNQLIEAKNDNIKVGNGDVVSPMDTVVDTSSLSEGSHSNGNECDDRVDAVVSTKTNQNTSSMAEPDTHHLADDSPLTNSNDNRTAPADTSTLTKCEEGDAYSDEDGAIVNFLGKANEIVGLVSSI